MLKNRDSMAIVSEMHEPLIFPDFVLLNDHFINDHFVFIRFLTSKKERSFFIEGISY